MICFNLFLMRFKCNENYKNRYISLGIIISYSNGHTVSTLLLVYSLKAFIPICKNIFNI